MKKMFAFYVREELGITAKKYYSICSSIIVPKIKSFMNGEFWEEMCGIAKGCGLPVLFIVGVNSLLSLYEYVENNLGLGEGKGLDDNKLQKQKKKRTRCSAFIATGDGITKDGKIIMAHNTHTDYMISQFQNIILRIIPEEGRGHPFVMQTMAGCVASGLDWFICSNGMIGCETTIADVNYKVDLDLDFDGSGIPYFLRIRKAMQYGSGLQDFKEIMLQNNAGDYPCSWLFGDCRTGEIAILELGLELFDWKVADRGIFYSMNIANNIRLRERETNDRSLNDLGTTSGSRNSRFEELLQNKYLGVIDIGNAKRIIADHYDTSLNRFSVGELGICNHAECSGDFRPYGSTDGKVVSTDLAMNGMQFWGIFGHPCGMPFIAKKYFKSGRGDEFIRWKPYLKDLRKGKWKLLG
jgi:hypothetical protein